MRLALVFLAIEALVCSASAQTKPDTGATSAGGNAVDDSAPRVRQPVPPQRRLAQRVPEVQFDDTTLSAWLDWVRDTYELNIVVHWERLRELGVERDQPITLHVRNLRLGQLLWLVLQQCEGAGDGRLGFRVDSETIIITSLEELNREMIIKVYDVQDLLASRLRNPSMSAVREHEIVTGLVPSVAAGAVGVRPVTERWISGSRLEGTDYGGEFYEDEDSSRTDPEQTMRELIGVIVTSVDPESWAVNGGRGSIESFRGRIVVRNTPRVHQLLGGPLREPD